mmetsp:Transcript_1589/g.2591  ORF Transcript_1589/g.2591 Transcript_1589/m.2591 type:complete len:376 (-) Transcript_1589:72-1199(-)
MLFTKISQQEFNKSQLFCTSGLIPATENDQLLFDVNAYDAQLKKDYRVFRLFLLVATCAQTTLDVLLRSWSRRSLGETYSSSSVLFVAESIKLGVSFVAGNIRLSGLGPLLRSSKSAAIPVLAYLVMNLLQFDALSRLDAASFSVASQLKTLWSAVFSVWLLSRSVSARKWRALLMLIGGVALIVHQAEVQTADCRKGGCGHGSAQMQPSHDYILGLLEVVVQTALSGFVAVWIEKYLKHNSQSLSVWEVNFQLAFWSLLSYAILALWPDTTHTYPFSGWSFFTCGIAMVTAAGGILVALCLRYTDAILKNFPTASSIVLVTGGSALLLDGPATLPTFVGSMLVAVSTFNYAELEVDLHEVPAHEAERKSTVNHS